MASNSFGSGGAAAAVMTSAPVSVSAAAAAAAAAVNADLWRECVAWLVRCKVIPADHKAALPDAEIRILAMTLRDGVLLCNLVIHLDPSSMDAREFNRKPQMAQVSESEDSELGRKLIEVFYFCFWLQFLCCKNIKLFLDVCHNHFNIRDADLFEPTMLYDLSNFHRVLITLSKLSQCRKVQQMHPELL